MNLSQKPLYVYIISFRILDIDIWTLLKAHSSCLMYVGSKFCRPRLLFDILPEFIMPLIKQSLDLSVSSSVRSSDSHELMQHAVQPSLTCRHC